MTIAQVLYVLEIADCRSISAAAERQFISQSALSQQIQRLEGELGYPLFVRTPRGLTLTAAGETFCREARPVAEQWQRLAAPSSRTDGAGAGCASVWARVCTPTGCFRILRAILTATPRSM